MKPFETVKRKNGRSLVLCKQRRRKSDRHFVFVVLLKNRFNKANYNCNYKYRKAVFYT